MLNIMDHLKNTFNRSELHEAVSVGDLERVRLLLESGADVNARDFYDNTPLMDACSITRNDFHKSMKEFNSIKEEKGSESQDFDFRNLPKFDPKQMIAMMDRKREYDDSPVEDDPTMAGILIKYGADVNAVDKGGHSALAKAVMAGLVDTSRLLLQHGADIRANDSSDMSILMLAARARKLETVLLLLERGADADYRVPQGGTTLMTAADGGRVEIAELFIAIGQDVNTLTVNGVTALQRAAANQHEEMVAYLKQQGARIGFLEAVLLGDFAMAKDLPVPEPSERGPDWGNLSLSRAVKLGRADLLSLLLERGVNPNPANDKQTVLMQAVMRGDVACARILLEAGANTKGATGEHSISPLACAGQRGDKDMLNLLLEFGADAKATRPDGASTLTGAVMSGQLETVRKLLEAGADPNAKVSEDGMTVLTFATIQNKQDMVKLLLEFGADPKSESELRTVFRAKDKPEISDMLRKAAGTDLHVLAKAGKTSDVLARLDAGADIDALDEMEGTLLMAALNGKQLETAQMLIERGANIKLANRVQFTALHFAIFSDNIDVIKMLITRGADVMAGDDSGKSPLYYSAISGKTEIIKILTEAGARIGTVEVALLGDLQTVRNLLDNGVDVNAPNGAGMTALMGAAAGGHLELISVLLTRHAEIDTTDEEGKTALAWATTYNHLEAVRLLLDNGADVNLAGVNQRYARIKLKHSKKNSENVLMHSDDWDENLGMSPLGCAAISGKVECAQLLIASGANVNARDGFSGHGIIGWAVTSGKAEMVRFLLDNGADPNIKDMFGNSLLEHAIHIGKSEEIIAMLKEAIVPKSVIAD